MRRQAASRLAWTALLIVLAPGIVRAQLFERAVVIENARVLTMNGASYDHGTIVMKGGKIVALGPGVKPPLFSRRYDAKGATVTPGLIDPWSALGMTPASSGDSRATLRAEDAFNHYAIHEIFGALSEGVTAVYLTPRGGPGIDGTGAIVRLAVPRNSAGEVLRTEAALSIDLGSERGPIERLKILSGMREQFRNALDYRKARERYEEDLQKYLEKIAKRAREAKAKDAKEGASAPKSAGGGKGGKKEKEKKEEELKKPAEPPRKPDFDVILKAIDREIPTRIRAQRSADILNALELADEFSLDLVIEGGLEAHEVAREIAARGVPVVLGLQEVPLVERDDLYRRWTPEAGSILSSAGIRCFAGSGGDHSSPARFVLLNSQLAAAHGAVRDPLRAVTVDAARLLGVQREIGRLRRGALADVVVWSGDPLAPGSKVERVYVGGHLTYVRPRQSWSSRKREGK